MQTVINEGNLKQNKFLSKSNITRTGEGLRILVSAEDIESQNPTDWERTPRSSSRDFEGPVLLHSGFP